MPGELPRWQVTLVNAVVAAAFAGAGVGGNLIAGQPGAMAGAAAGAGAGQVLSSTVQGFLARAHRRRAEQAMRAVEVGSTMASLPTEEMLNRLDTPAGQELLVEAMQAAARATVEAKIGALGRSLAAGALGADEVDRELLFVRAMADLEASHLRILEHLDSAHSPGYPDGLYALQLDQLTELPGIGPAIRPLIGTLERHGVVEALPPDMDRLFAEFSKQVASAARSGTAGGGSFSRSDTEGRWKISRFGRECLARLRAAGLDQPQDPE